MIRQAEEKPTWIVETEQPFEKAFCYSPELSLYIEDRFESLTLDGASEPDEDPGMELEEDVPFEESSPDEPPASEPPPPDEPDVDVEALEAAIGGGGNPARLIALAAGLPERVAGLSIDRQCAGGLDALLSTVQMPGGIPVATVAIGKAGASNAALLAAGILLTLVTIAPASPYAPRFLPG